MKPKKSSADNLLHKTILLFLQFLLPVNCFVVISTGKILQPNTTIVKSSLESTVEAGLESVMKTMSPTETSHGKSKLSTVIGMTIYLYYTCITVEQTIFCNIQKEKEQIIQCI